MDFKELQTRLEDARRARETGESRVSRDREALKRLEVRGRTVGRTHGPDSDVRRTLDTRLGETSASLAAGEAELATARARHRELLAEFEGFMDPRDHVERLPDAYPLLLFPLRLETRFKIVRDGDGAPRHQLWVRVFPDACSIDTFDEILSVSEVERARRYWAAVWAAGEPAAGLETFVEDRQRGAWRKLMGVFNAGRARWVIQSHRPVDETGRPARASEADILLVIPTEEPPAEPARGALETYWAAHFAAAGDLAAVQDAFARLMVDAGVDEATARGLLERYRPVNLDEGPSGPEGAVSVTFLAFPQDAEVKLTAWSQAAKVRTLPEKLVLLGYQDDLTEPVIEELGRPIPDPLIVGPDTGDDIEEVLRQEFGPDVDEWTDDEKAAKYVEYLSERSDTRWLFDFEAAVEMGLGFRVSLTEEQYRAGFRRLVVAGVRLSGDAEAGSTALERLLHNHQRGDSGLSLLPQGTPTNNTDEKASGYSETEDADEAFDRFFVGEAPEDPDAPDRRRDGRHLATLLGIDPDAAGLPLVDNYFGGDEVEARAMHTALWSATMGYFLESMVTPVTSVPDRERIRRFLIDHVRGRGALPALRIGNQPYGILPISDLRALAWWGRTTTTDALAPAGAPFLATLFSVLSALREDWESLIDRVAYVGKSGQDPHRVLLEALGLHAQSVSFDRRVAESFQQIKNALYAQGVLGDEIDQLDVAYRAAGLALLEHLGYEQDDPSDPRIPILDKSFLGVQDPVSKDLVDDTPLSEADPIRPYTDEGLNYIAWLAENARESHANIRDQKGFTDDEPPSALLYDMLRHAVNLEFGNTGLKLHEEAGVLSASEVAVVKVDADTIGVRTDSTELESKWDIIYRRDDRIANGELLADAISAMLRTDAPEESVRHLSEVVEALEILRELPTARLERCFVEHLDCCSYRLDAWLLGLLHAQLEAMRSVRARRGAAGGEERPGGGRGLYLGAYGWLENLEAQERELTPAPLDENLRPIFDPDDEGDIVRDSSNAGYVHAPSINHAVTAAVLRNAYISAADEDAAERYKVNLSSERVRAALSIIEGMQQGQRLGALLGYHLERALHDYEEELDVYIYELRKVFPLGANRLKTTAVERGKVGATPDITARHAEEASELEEDRAISKVEARNVVDGYALLEHVKATGVDGYPFGFPEGEGPGRLKPPVGNAGTLITREVERLKNVRDAVADLALAESVHQVVQGNYERAAGALDSYSKGGFPHLPHVVQSPGSGVTLTHRFAVHLPTAVGPGSGTTPRSKIEPGVNAWAADLLPPPADIACEVRFRAPDYGVVPPSAWSSLPLTMADLGLEPIDVLYLEGPSGSRDVGGLDDHVLRAFHEAAPRRPDLEIEINYTTSVGGAFTFFEMAALTAPLRKLAVAARPLVSSDLAVPSESGAEKLPGSSVDPARVEAAKTMLDDALSDLRSGFVDVFRVWIDPEDVEVGVSNSADILAAIDAGSAAFVSAVSRLALFGTVRAGSGFVHDRRLAIQRSLFETFLAYRASWDERKSRYDGFIAGLAGAADDTERARLLHQAEAQVSATHTSNFANIGALEAVVVAKRGDFDARYDDITAFLTTDFVSLQDLFSAATSLLATLAPLGLEPPVLDRHVRAVVVFAEDMLNQAAKLVADGESRSAAVQTLLDEAAASASDQGRLDAMTEATTLMFGEGFRIVPHFGFGDDQRLELQNCWNDRASLLTYQRTERGSDFPVDDWLYGVARVRENVAAWERVAVLAEGFRDRAPLDPTPLQLPYQDGDPWLALAFPEFYVIDSDKLLYTAFMDGFDPAQPQCGLLVDEWTEVIPSTEETTGMVFHYDQPNSEPPQAWLLATPSAFRGGWLWQDVVRSVHEALDLARLRAVEPDLVESLPRGYARFLPMTVATLTRRRVTMALDYVRSEIPGDALATVAPIDG